MLPTLELAQLKDLGLYRSLNASAGVDFVSNDFLGLARSEKVRSALLRFLEAGGPLGSTGSRLVSGESEFLRETEDFLASTFRAPSALLFGSGYLANLGAIGALASPGTSYFSDELNHASLVDGMRLTKAKIEIFQHNDLNHLEKLLAASPAKRKVIVGESIFSMDGDGPDLAGLKRLVDESGAYLILDEAHATGVAGPRGLGLADGMIFDFARTILIHTCGKALGGYGAFATTGKSLRELLINKARSFIYSTAPAPLQVAQTKAALEEILSEPGLLLRLKRNIEMLHRELARVGVKASAGHILPILVPGNDRVIKVVNHLAEKGFATKGIRYPTVPEGSERIRITAKAFHNETDIHSFASALAEALQ